MTQKLNKRGRPMFERTVFGRLRRSVDFGDGKLVAFKFELKPTGLHVRRRGARKESVLPFKALANASRKQPELFVK